MAMSFKLEPGEDMSKEWTQFSSQGCGLVYYEYLRPWLEGELSILANLPIDLGSIQRFAVQTLGLNFLLQYLNVDTKSEGEVSGYFSSVKSYLFAPSPSAGSEGSKDDAVVAEYDVIDKPEQPGVTQRKVSRGWLW